MTWKTKAAAGVVFALVLAATLAVKWRAAESDRVASAPAVAGGPTPQFLPQATPFAAPAETKASSPARALSAEKKARLEQIRRDYGEIRAKMVQEYGAAGQKFPGGLNAFLRQLALLEREMHADFAKALTPEELEDYEMQESTTGKAIEQRVADLRLTDEQKRVVYRVQREFDDRFALVFDVSPAALLERMKAQLIAREKIRATLGDEAYAKWLRAEDPGYFALQKMVQEQGLRIAVDDLWRIKDDWTQRKLEIAADSRLSPEQQAGMQAALAEQTRSRVLALVGSHAVQSATEAFSWLPPVP